MRNTLYYGDNLTIMREHIADESVDLVYLDPPFNSARDYNVLFKQAKKDENQAQIIPSYSLLDGFCLSLPNSVG